MAGTCTQVRRALRRVSLARPHARTLAAAAMAAWVAAGGGIGTPANGAPGMQNANPAAARATGRLAGRIVDTSGAPLAGITLIVISPELAQPRTVVTDASGRFEVAALPPGRVAVTCNAPGFVQWRREGIEIGRDAPVTLNVTMRRPGEMPPPTAGRIGRIGGDRDGRGTLPPDALPPPTVQETPAPPPPPPPPPPPTGEPPLTETPATAGPADPDPAEHELLGEIDRYLQRLDPGNIAFNAPERMQAGEAMEIRLLLSPRLGAEALQEQLEGLPGTIQGAVVRIAPRMEASLTGQDFAITAITPAAQAVSRDEPTEWRWQVTADKAGSHRLHLVLNATIEGTSRTLRTFDRTIVVEVTWGQQISGFAQDHWQWLWTTALVPLAGWVWKRRRRTPAAAAAERSEAGR